MFLVQYPMKSAKCNRCRRRFIRRASAISNASFLATSAASCFEITCAASWTFGSVTCLIFAASREIETVSELPNCDKLFLRFLDPWYDEDDRRYRGTSATRPDITHAKNLVGNTPDSFGRLNEEGRRNVRARIDGMLEAVRGDWPNELKVDGDIDLKWIGAFDAHYDRRRIQEVIDASDPTVYSNEYLVLVCEFGASLGYVLRKALPRLTWWYEWPYWESSLFDTETGSVIPVFHWAVKKMSEYGVDDGYVAKVRACTEFVEKRRRNRS